MILMSKNPTSHTPTKAIKSASHAHDDAKRSARSALRTNLLYPLSLALVMFTTSAMAKIHPTAFKGVSEHFMVKVKKGKDSKDIN